MQNLAARVQRAIRKAGVSITGLSIGDDADRATWLVTPPSLQAAAAPIIAAFEYGSAEVEQDELSDTVKGMFDGQRVLGAIVWAIIDTYDPPASQAKYGQLRAKVIQVFKSKPFTP